MYKALLCSLLLGTPEAPDATDSCFRAQVFLTQLRVAARAIK